LLLINFNLCISILLFREERLTREENGSEPMHERTAFFIVSSLIIAAAQFVLSGGNQARIDIVHTDLRVYVDKDTPHLRGDVHYTAVVGEHGTEGVLFHSYWLAKDSIKVNGVDAHVTLSPEPGGEEFFIHLPDNVFPGDTIALSIWYERIADTGQPGRDPGRGGYYFFEKDSSRWGDTALHTTAYTMSQPNDARAWFPTIDKPSNKSTLTFHITVSEPVPVIANGELMHIIDNDDGSQTYIYDHSYPIPPYLFAFNVGPFEEYMTTYQSIDGRTIPVASYLFEEDQHKAVEANDHMVYMLGLFEELFGEYPFERYGMIGLSPFRWTGMEHQTITTMRRAIYTNELIIAHELAHHWWGNLVTCESWKNIWLNEGFASYSEILYEEAIRGIPSRDALLSHFAHMYFSDDQLKRYQLHDPPEDRLFGWTIYRKGAWVLHMLRLLIGDELFFHALKEYASAHRYATATTESLLSVFETVTGMELGWFFDQWVYAAGHPVYRFEGSIIGDAEGGDADVIIRLHQVQVDAPEVFEGPVDYLIVFGDSDTTVTFWNDERDQEFILTFHALPDTILFDPDYKILKKVESATISVDEQEHIPASIVLHQNYPNPFNHFTTITFELPEPLDVQLKVVDISGRLVEYLVDERRNEGIHSVTFNAGKYASGAYFAVLKTDQVNKIRKMLYVK